MCSFNCWPVGHRDVNEISGFKGFTAILMVQICGNVLPVVFVWTEAGPLSWRGKCAACAQYGGPTGRCPGCDVVNSLPRRQASVFHQDTDRSNKYMLYKCLYRRFDVLPPFLSNMSTYVLSYFFLTLDCLPAVSKPYSNNVFVLLVFYFIPFTVNSFD